MKILKVKFQDGKEEEEEEEEEEKDKKDEDKDENAEENDVSESSRLVRFHLSIGFLYHIIYLK